MPGSPPLPDSKAWEVRRSSQPFEGSTASPPTQRRHTVGQRERYDSLPGPRLYSAEVSKLRARSGADSLIGTVAVEKMRFGTDGMFPLRVVRPSTPANKKGLDNIEELSSLRRASVSSFGKTSAPELIPTAAIMAALQEKFDGQGDRTMRRSRSISLSDLSALSSAETDTDKIPPQEYFSRAAEQDPELKSLVERVDPLRRTVALLHKYELKQGNLELSHIVELVVKHLREQGHSTSARALEQELDAVESQPEANQASGHMNANGSSLRSLLQLAISRSELLYGHALVQKKKPGDSKVEDILAAMGFPNSLAGENIWKDLDTEQLHDASSFLTLNQLLRSLTSEFASADEKSLRQFFCTYHSFTTPLIVLEKIRERYNIPDWYRRGFEDRNHRIRVVKTRVIEFLQFWLRYHFEDFAAYRGLGRLEERVTAYGRALDSDFPSGQQDEYVGHSPTGDEFKSLVRDLHSSGETAAAQILQDSFLRAETAYFASLQGFDRVVGSCPPVLFPENLFRQSWTPPDKSNLRSVDELEVARQMTLIDFRLFSRVKSQELINKAWTKSSGRKRAPFLSAMIERSNLIANWVATEVVTPNSAHLRAEALTFFIRVASCCKQLGNYHGLMSLIAGCHQHTVVRLKRTWQRLRRLNPQAHIEYSSLVDFVKPDGNFSIMREEMLARPPPVVPNLVPFLRDLTDIDEEFGLLPDSNSEAVFINLVKSARFCKVLDVLAHMTEKHYALAPVTQIQRALLGLSVPKDNRLLRLSLLAEPDQKLLDTGGSYLEELSVHEEATDWLTQPMRKEDWEPLTRSAVKHVLFDPQVGEVLNLTPKLSAGSLFLVDSGSVVLLAPESSTVTQDAIPSFPTGSTMGHMSALGFPSASPDIVVTADSECVRSGVIVQVSEIDVVDIREPLEADPRLATRYYRTLGIELAARVRNIGAKNFGAMTAGKAARSSDDLARDARGKKERKRRKPFFSYPCLWKLRLVDDSEKVRRSQGKVAVFDDSISLSVRSLGRKREFEVRAPFSEVVAKPRLHQIRIRNEDSETTLQFYDETTTKVAHDVIRQLDGIGDDDDNGLEADYLAIGWEAQPFWATISANAAEKSFAAGDVILREGEKFDRRLFIVASGECTVLNHDQNRAKVRERFDIDTLRAEDVFGEKSLLLNQPEARSRASVVASGDCVVRILRKPLEHLSQEPRFCAQFMEHLARFIASSAMRGTYVDIG